MTVSGFVRDIFHTLSRPRDQRNTNIPIKTPSNYLYGSRVFFDCTISIKGQFQFSHPLIHLHNEREITRRGRGE